MRCTLASEGYWAGETGLAADIRPNDDAFDATFEGADVEVVVESRNGTYVDDTSMVPLVAAVVTVE